MSVPHPPCKIQRYVDHLYEYPKEVNKGNVENATKELNKFNGGSSDINVAVDGWLLAKDSVNSSVNGIVTETALYSGRESDIDCISKYCINCPK
jgi:hypothetical protein